MHIHVNGHQVYAEQHGPELGPPVVLLHHGLGSVRAWKEQVPVLAQAGYRVVVYDRWGYGLSEERPEIDMPAFQDDQADLRLLLETLQIERPHLVGHSDGGTIALYYAAEHPENVRSLTTIAAHIYVETKMYPGIAGLKSTFDQDQRFRELLRRAHGEKYAGVFRNWFEGWMQERSLSWDMRPLLARITCPAWIVQGMEDEHATPRHAQDAAAAIPGAILWLLPEAGHMLPQENAAAFNPRLLEFIGKIGD